jgi:hypothetical protein
LHNTNPVKAGPAKQILFGLGDVSKKIGKEDDAGSVKVGPVGIVSNLKHDAGF